MTKKESKLIDLLSRKGFKIDIKDGELTLEPTVIRLRSLEIKSVKKGMYIKEPSLFSGDQEDNIFYFQLPMEVSATTLSGEVIPVYFEMVGDGQQVTIIQETIIPD